MLFNWIRNKLINRQRMIFEYWNGSFMCRADPIVLFRNLRNHEEFNIDAHLSRSDMLDPFCSVKNPIAEEAYGLCVKAAREVFNIPALEEGRGRWGLTEQECVALLKAFLNYALDLKKSFSLMQTNSESIPPQSFSSQLPQLPPENDTKPIADSTSTSCDPASGSPPTSETEHGQSSDPTSNCA